MSLLKSACVLLSTEAKINTTCLLASFFDQLNILKEVENDYDYIIY